jgi:hypothetical protein
MTIMRHISCKALLNVGWLMAAAALIAGNTALAQPADALSDCAGIADQDARLACYDALVRSDPPAHERDTAPAVPAAARPAGAIETPRPVASAPVAAEPAEAEAEAEITAAPSAENRRERRLSLRRSRASTPREESVQIIEVRTGISDLRVFTTADGRVYEQISTDSTRIPETPFDAQIERATFGSFFLTPAGANRPVRVSLRD